MKESSGAKKISVSFNRTLLRQARVVSRICGFENSFSAYLNKLVREDIERHGKAQQNNAQAA